MDCLFLLLLVMLMVLFLLLLELKYIGQNSKVVGFLFLPLFFLEGFSTVFIAFLLVGLNGEGWRECFGFFGGRYGIYSCNCEFYEKRSCIL